MINAFLGVLRKEFWDLKRYPLDTISALIVIYVLFLLIFVGVRYAVPADETFGDTTESLVVGFVVIAFINNAFQNLGSYISSQATVGTLEHLYLSPFGFRWIAVFKMVSGLIYNLSFNAVVLVTLMLTTGKWLHLDLLSIGPLAVAIVLQAYALGLVMGGLALVYKRVQSLYQVLSLLMIVFVAAPPDVSPLVRLLPFNLEWRMLRQIMGEGERLLNFPLEQLMFVPVHTLMLFGAGWTVYLACERIALKEGLLSQY